jgi:hypothetical protein
LPAIDEGQNTMVVRRSSGVAFIARPVNGGVDRPFLCETVRRVQRRRLRLVQPTPQH